VNKLLTNSAIDVAVRLKPIVLLFVEFEFRAIPIESLH